MLLASACMLNFIRPIAWDMPAFLLNQHKVRNLERRISTPLARSGPPGVECSPSFRLLDKLLHDCEYTLTRNSAAVKNNRRQIVAAVETML